MGEGDGGVDEDDGVVGVDRCHTMIAPAAFRRHRERAPSFFFFLDLPPRWEEGFPSGPWSPWRRRGRSPSEIGSLSLSVLFCFAFLFSGLSSFLKFPEIRNSDCAEILTCFFVS